jgi:small subunit ribosomal protein S6
MAFYETVYIARQDLSNAQNEELTKEFAKIIQDNGGKIENTEYWGLRQLAYKIKKNKKGHYTLFHISGESAAVKELERIMRLNEDILRFMTITLDELPKGPSIMMQDNDEGTTPSGRSKPRKQNTSDKKGDE